MHGTIKTQANQTRARVMRAAWSMFREARAAHAGWAEGLAAELRSRHAFIDAATSDADRAARITSVTRSYHAFTAREPDMPSFAQCLRDAWRAEKVVSADTIRAAFDVERWATDCRYGPRMEDRRLAVRADIGRREAAARAVANAQ